MQVPEIVEEENQDYETPAAAVTDNHMTFKEMMSAMLSQMEAMKIALHIPEEN